MKRISQIMIAAVLGFLTCGFADSQADFMSRFRGAHGLDQSGSCHDQPYIYIENNYKAARELKFNIVLVDGRQHNMNVRKKDGAKFIMPQGVRTIRAYDGSTLIGTYNHYFPREHCRNSNKYRAWKVTIKKNRSWDYRVV